MDYKILVCIDCQNDFITGSLRNEEAIKAVPKIVDKIRNFNGAAIYVTRDTHTADYLKTREGKNLPVEHCIKASWGWQIEDNIQAALNDAELRRVKVVYIDKPTIGSHALADSISSTVDYASRLEKETFNPEVEVVGFCTDICVVSNTLMIKERLYDRATVKVDSSCCAGVTPELHESALNVMKSCQIEII